MVQNKQDKIRLAVWFAVSGDLRYLSHRDTMRAWCRILVRAHLPLRYSCGFNPHLRMSLPLPRSVGMAAYNELLLVELSERPELDLVMGRIGDRLPTGLSVTHAQLIPPDTATQPQWAAYRLDLPENVDRAELRQRIRQFEAAEQWLLQRPARKRRPARTIDLRRCLDHLALGQQHLSFDVNITTDATCRIDEILPALQLDQPHLVSCVTRTKTHYPELIPDKTTEN